MIKLSKIKLFNMALVAPPVSFLQHHQHSQPLFQLKPFCEVIKKRTLFVDLFPKSTFSPFASVYSRDLLTPSTKFNHQHLLIQEITHLCESRNFTKALNLLEENLDNACFGPDEIALAMGVLLGACGMKNDIETGRKVHEMIWASTHFRNDSVLNTRIITMYSMCGSPLDSRSVFNQLQYKNLYQWNALLSGYTRNEFYHDTVCAFCELVSVTSYKPDNFTFPCVIKACGGLLDMGLGEAIHGMTVKIGLFPDVYVGNALVTMYGKFGMSEAARKLFEYMPQRNLVSWNSMISVLSDDRCFQLSVDFFCKLLVSNEDLVPDSATLATILPVCAREGDVIMGKAVHGIAVKLGKSAELTVSNALIDMYLKCGFLVEARILFNRIYRKNLVSWNSMIGIYSRQGDVDGTFDLLRKMQMTNDNLKPDNVTLLSVLPVCLQAAELLSVKELHAYSFRHGFESDQLVRNAFITAYSRCGLLSSAQCVFNTMDNNSVSSWNALIGGYLQNRDSSKALDLYLEMTRSGLDPDLISIGILLSACTQLKTLCHGKQIHGFVFRNGLDTDLFISTSLLSLYFSCGVLFSAQVLFESLENRSIVSWNTMIAGYSQNGMPGVALNVCRQMVSDGIQPCGIAMVSVLGACSQLSSLRLGKEAHCFALKGQLTKESFINCSIIDMYAKNGSIELAQKAFDQLQAKDTALCTVMISGYAIHGYGKEANKLFQNMKNLGLKPDRFTFIGLLMACDHAGLIGEGLKYFSEMHSLHNIVPELEHYACVVGMLGRTGRFADALEVVAKMPVQPDARIWSSLLSSSRIRGELDLGERFADNLLKLEPNRAESYVLVSNFFAGYGNWDEVRRMRGRMKAIGQKKDVGCSWIEIGGKSYSFIVGDQMLPESKEIGDMWRRLEEKISEIGYLPDLGSVLHELNEEEKLEILRGHSEKLAISFGLLKTTKYTTIRVCKNLRICQDCHNAIKLVSAVIYREIIVRDNKRFHHFREGLCSCGDYW